ncbi:hypothetical protein B0H66DRAFT_624165 [Apodospora peruviana]|uniref:FAD linked oxidase N-terminal domain-containing protein n=1 Tax=Apodospora peruviana TaxID=516989 RepID=A0AAE0I826_9PEZI|nr:hypothetical protein B0H66DRAFT_624165 [Apodospora peruviana]
MGPYYSNGAAKLRPACIVQPQSADEVARAVKMLAADRRTKFAVRSDGCSFWPNNNIEDGVTYHEEEDTVSIGTGARWGEVYGYLENYGRTVGGGREATGATTSFSGRFGLTCDQVIRFEVVLANGDIVLAEEGGDEHQDLLVALRGGGSNFGLWGGGRVFSTADVVIGEVARSFVDITNNIARDPDTALICMVANLEPGQKKPVVVASLCANLAGVENPPILEEWLSFPTVLDLCKKETTLLEVMASTKQRPGYHCMWFTLTFHNSAFIMFQAVALHAELVAKLEAHITEGSFISQCLFSANVLGNESQDRDGILWSGHVMVPTPDLEKWAYPHVCKCYEDLRDFAESEEGLLPRIPANYADPDQKVLQSYGPDNVRFMHEVANRYDPAGVFQSICPGGFKISAVDD